IDQTTLYAREVEKVYQTIPEHGSIFRIAFPTFGFAGMVTKPWSERTRGIQQIQMEASMKSSQIAGIRAIQIVPPSLPGSGEGFPVDMVLVSTAEPQRLADFAKQLVGEAFKSGKFMYADTDLKFDQPQAKVVFDR